MNFHGVADDTGKEMKEAVDYILKLNISPQDKRKLLISIFSTVGDEFFDKMFGDASELFDSTAMSSNGLQSNDDQIQRLATKLLRNDALGRSNNLTKEYFNAIQSDAFEEAFTNAKSLDRHPTLTRYVVGETCKWCNALAGVHINPTSDMYRRHADCDCILEYSGANGRREIVKNYTKKQNNNDNNIESVDEEKFRKKIFGDNVPGVGDEIIIEHSRQNRHDDVLLANYFKQKYGGGYVVIGDDWPNGTRSPDLLLKNYSVFENKKVTTNQAIDSQVRIAIKQLDNSVLKKIEINDPEKLNHVIVLNIKDGVSYTFDEIKRDVLHRIARTRGHRNVDVDYVILKYDNGEERIFNV